MKHTWIKAPKIHICNEKGCPATKDGGLYLTKGQKLRLRDCIVEGIKSIEELRIDEIDPLNDDIKWIAKILNIETYEDYKDLENI